MNWLIAKSKIHPLSAASSPIAFALSVVCFTLIGGGVAASEPTALDLLALKYRSVEGYKHRATLTVSYLGESRKVDTHGTLVFSRPNSMFARLGDVGISSIDDHLLIIDYADREVFRSTTGERFVVDPNPSSIQESEIRRNQPLLAIFRRFGNRSIEHADHTLIGFCQSIPLRLLVDESAAQTMRSDCDSVQDKSDNEEQAKSIHLRGYRGLDVSLHLDQGSGFIDTIRVTLPREPGLSFSCKFECAPTDRASASDELRLISERMTEELSEYRTRNLKGGGGTLTIVQTPRGGNSIAEVIRKFIGSLFGQ